MQPVIIQHVSLVSCSEPHGLLLTLIEILYWQHWEQLESSWSRQGKEEAAMTEACHPRRSGETQGSRHSRVDTLPGLWTVLSLSLCPTSSQINRTFQLPLWEAHNLARRISKRNSSLRAEHQTKMTIEQVKSFSGWDSCLPDKNPDW